MVSESTPAGAPTPAPVPTYSSPTYQAPANYSAIPTGQIAAEFSQVPQVTPQYTTPTQVIQASNKADLALPSDLQLATNPLLSAGTQEQDETNAANQFYSMYEAPQVASQQTANYAQGMQNSTAGGAQVGTLQAQGQAQAGMYGQQYYTNELNNLLNERNNFFGNDVGTTNTVNALTTQAQEANQSTDAQLAQALAGFQAENSTNQNQYNLNTTGMANQFGLTNSQNLNQYNLTGAQQADTLAANVFGTQGSMANNQLNANTKLITGGGNNGGKQ